MKKVESEVINFYYDIKGEIKIVPFNSNAVIVHLFPESNREGGIYFKQVVTISCPDMKNKKMLKELKKEAHRIVRKK